MLWPFYIWFSTLGVYSLEISACTSTSNTKCRCFEGFTTVGKTHKRCKCIPGSGIKILGNNHISPMYAFVSLHCCAILIFFFSFLFCKKMGKRSVRNVPLTLPLLHLTQNVTWYQLKGARLNTFSYVLNNIMKNEVCYVLTSTFAVCFFRSVPGNATSDVNHRIKTKSVELTSSHLPFSETSTSASAVTPTTSRNSDSTPTTAISETQNSSKHAICNLHCYNINNTYTNVLACWIFSTEFEWYILNSRAGLPCSFCALHSHTKVHHVSSEKDRHSTTR